jgi:hypothetical protein
MMDNKQRDELLMEIHGDVKGLKATELERQKQCEAHNKQISTLFEGFNQIQRNTTSIRIIAVAFTVIGGAMATAIFGILF